MYNHVFHFSNSRDFPLNSPYKMDTLFGRLGFDSSDIKARRGTPLLIMTSNRSTRLRDSTSNPFWHPFADFLEGKWVIVGRPREQPTQPVSLNVQAPYFAF